MQTDEARIEERITTIVRGPDGKVKLSGPEVKVGANFALLTGGKRSEWFNYGWYYHDIASKIQEPTNYRKFIELGTWKGHSICYLANEINKYRKSNMNIEIYSVDTFKPTVTSSMHQEGNLESICFGNIKILGMEPYLKILKKSSHEAALQFEDGYFDFVFIDADHVYERVKEDIDDWLPKVKKGGILAGHDYAPSQKGIIKAVNDKFGDKKTVGKVGVWEVKI